MAPGTVRPITPTNLSLDGICEAAAAPGSGFVRSGRTQNLPIASGCLSIFGYFPLSLFGAEGLRIQGPGLLSLVPAAPKTFPLPPDASPKGLLFQPLNDAKVAHYAAGRLHRFRITTAHQSSPCSRARPCTGVQHTFVG